ncbi:MAG: metal-dependent hydrolase [Bdellovibrionota bacterium]
MASAFSHIAIPIVLTVAVGRKKIPWKLLSLGLFLSVAPDFDSLAFRFDIPYESQWGHRGFTHSIVFAIIVASLCVCASKFLSAKPKVVFLFSFASLISHGILDAFTNGGLGVAFLWPLTSERYFFPWQVIEVSPISISRFFTHTGLVVLQSEALYIWLPCVIVGGLFLWRRNN